MSRGVTKTVRAEQTPHLPGTVHKILKRNATLGDLAQVRARKGAIIRERMGGAIGGVPVEHDFQEVRPYVIVDAYIDDLKRLVAVLVEATAINEGVNKNGTNGSDAPEEDATN